MMVRRRVLSVVTAFAVVWLAAWAVLATAGPTPKPIRGRRRRTRPVLPERANGSTR